MNIDAEAFKEIVRLSELHTRQRKRMMQTEEQLRIFVMDYMNKNNFGKTADELTKIIDCLPVSSFKMNMYSLLFELREAEESAVVEQPTEGRPKDEENKSVLDQIKTAREAQRENGHAPNRGEKSKKPPSYEL